MKNKTKAMISGGIGIVGMQMYMNSLKCQNDKIVWNPIKGIPGMAFLVNGLMIAGVYAANPNFSVIDNVKCILHKK